VLFGFGMFSNIIELRKTEIQNLRLTNWELVLASSQMVAVCSLSNKNLVKDQRRRSEGGE
jgi:hypothetical protein